MKLLTIVGARPQFIKAATVSRVVRESSQVTEYLVHTGQHYDEKMSDIFFNELDIPKPDVNLEIGSGLHGVQTGKMLTGIEAVLLQEEPDWVLVYGDTNSTLAGALAAAKLNIPVAHVEAGLRSFNRAMPEEINRIATDHVSDILFAPTETAVKNLQNEGISPKKIHRVGDVMYDAALFYAHKAAKKRSLLQDISVSAKKYILATVHRAENTDEPARLRMIWQGLNQIAEEIPVVLPLHPRTRKALATYDIPLSDSPNFHIIEPVGYLDMVMLEKNARLIVTDSGGVQKEAYFHGILCVTLRDETEWVELVEAGWNVLASPRNNNILDMIQKMLKKDSTAMIETAFYGNGHSAEKIVAALLRI